MDALGDGQESVHVGRHCSATGIQQHHQSLGCKVEGCKQHLHQEDIHFHHECYEQSRTVGRVACQCARRGQTSAAVLDTNHCTVNCIHQYPAEHGVPPALVQLSPVSSIVSPRRGKQIRPGRRGGLSHLVSWHSPIHRQESHRPPLCTPPNLSRCLHLQVCSVLGLLKTVRRQGSLWSRLKNDIHGTLLMMSAVRTASPTNTATHTRRWKVKSWGSHKRPRMGGRLIMEHARCPDRAVRYQHDPPQVRWYSSSFLQYFAEVLHAARSFAPDNCSTCDLRISCVNGVR